jgi:hypothetical protein
MPLRPAVALGCLLLLAACAGPPAPSGVTPDPSPSTAASPSAPPSVAPVPTTPASPRPTASPTTQSDSAWGRIWDDLPPGFPVPPAATATDIDEPVSAAFDVPAGVADTATLMQSSLERSNFSTFALSGPLEDGTIVIDSVGPTTTDCRVETTISPLGGLTRLTIRYGAACPLG